jgi:hypothetical protein
MLRVAHNFGRLEALGTYGASGRLNDAADPLTLEVLVTLPDGTVVESQLVGLLSGPQPYKLATGTWVADLTERLYVTEQQYVVHWRYTMTPNNLKVDRSTFKFCTPAPDAHDPEWCNIYGTATDMIGVPLPDVDVTAETYENVVTMSKRTGQRTIRTDAFGNWWVPLRKESLARFVLGASSKVIVVPTLSRASLASITAVQPSDAGAKDRYGYAFPG